MRRYKYELLCVIISILVLMCGCSKMSGGEEHAGSMVKEPQYEWGKFTGRTLTVWGREVGLERPYILRALERYEELTGNKIRTVGYSENDFGKLTAADLTGEEKPDLVLGFGGTNIDAFQPDENFYDFTDSVWVDDLTDTSINHAIYAGKIIGLPHWEASISGIIYNKKVFDDHNIALPRTQEEFLQVCSRLLDSGIVPLYMPCEPVTMLFYQFPLDTLVEDEATLQELNDGTLGYQDLEGLKAVLEWYRTMAQKGYLGMEYEKNSYEDMGPALDSGNYAMALGWDTWIHLNLPEQSGRFGIMPAFMGVPEEGTFEGPNLSLMMVNRNSDQVDAAVDFVTFMADPYNYNVAFEGLYTAPVFKGQLTQVSTPQYVEAADWIERNYHDSTAWLRIRGFSQTDASCILDYMSGDGTYTAEQCLLDMERLRQKRLGEVLPADEKGAP